MREILFRGQNSRSKKWIYGYYNGRENSFARIIDTDNFTRLVNPETVGQYTGLKDVHNTRVFEGDIVKVYDVYCNETVVGVVEFCDGSFRIYDKDFTSYDRWMYGKVEVIGNVFDSPELLEGDKT